MKKLYFFTLLIIMMSCSTPEITQEDSIYVPETKEIETEIMSIINDWRVSEELNFLLPNPYVKAQAYTHTVYMISQGEVSHDNFLKRREALKEIGAIRVGENVAFGYSSAETVVESWLSSSGHKCIIKGDYTHFDISIEKDTNDKNYYTNIFIKL